MVPVAVWKKMEADNRGAFSDRSKDSITGISCHLNMMCWHVTRDSIIFARARNSSAPAQLKRNAMQLRRIPAQNSQLRFAWAMTVNKPLETTAEFNWIKDSSNR